MLLNNFKVGDTLSAVVKEVMPKTDTCLIEVSGRTFTAASEIMFSKGDCIIVEVTEIKPDIVFKPVKITEDEFKKEKSLLRACKIDATERNLLIMRKYLSEKREVQLDKIHQYFKNSRNK